MFSDKRFSDLKERFKIVKRCYAKLIEEKRAAAVKTVFSKGSLYNVLPFESELCGFKLNGKVLKEPIVSNECNIYRLDENDAVILKERFSDFLKIPYDFTQYSYCDSYIECIYGTGSEPDRIEWAFLEQGKVDKLYYFAKTETAYKEYFYNQKDLNSIKVYRKAQPLFSTVLNYEMHFIYDKSSLCLIQQIWENEARQTVYTTAKINYKALGERLLIEAEQALSDFFKEHDKEFMRFALDCYTGHGHISFCLDASVDENYEESPADYEYYDFKSIELVSFPLDDEEEKRVRRVLFKLAENLKNSKVFKRFAGKNFKIFLFDHNEIMSWYTVV